MMVVSSEEDCFPAGVGVVFGELKNANRLDAEPGVASFSPPALPLLKKLGDDVGVVLGDSIEASVWRLNIFPKIY